MPDSALVALLKKWNESEDSDEAVPPEVHNAITTGRKGSEWLAKEVGGGSYRDAYAAGAYAEAKSEQ